MRVCLDTCVVVDNQIIELDMELYESASDDGRCSTAASEDQR